MPIVYGLPAGPQLFRAADRGEVELGGCTIIDGLPRVAVQALRARLDPIELPA